MVVENPIILEAAYYLGLLAMFGIGFEFIALKVPDFRSDLRGALDDIFFGFLSSWQLGFLLMFIAARYVGGVAGDLLFFLGFGIAIPDLPTKFKRYWKYLVLVLSLSGMLPQWLIAFLTRLPERSEKSGEGEEEAEEEAGQEETVEWGEPTYVRK